LFAPGKTSRWIILLSGFTGIATYGLALLLTSLDVKTSKDRGGHSLQEVLKEKGIDIESDGLQVLIKVRYKSKAKSEDQHRDTRELNEPNAVTIVDVKPAPKGALTCEAQHGHSEQQQAIR
jgi:GH35 family endo-1,4-beta-xylanase